MSRENGDQKERTFGEGVIDDVMSVFGNPARDRHELANDLASDLEQLDPWVRAARHLAEARAALRLASTAGPPQVADDVGHVSKMLDTVIADTREQIGCAKAAAIGWQFRASLRATDPESYEFLALFEAFTAHVADLGLPRIVVGYATLHRYSGPGGQRVEVLFIEGDSVAWVSDGSDVKRLDATGPEDALATFTGASTLTT